MTRDMTREIRRGDVRAQSRILITRDRKIASRRDGADVAVYVLDSNDPKSQLEEIASRFGIGLNSENFMMRCAVCNGYGYRKVAKEEAEERGDCPAGVLAQARRHRHVSHAPIHPSPAYDLSMYDIDNSPYIYP